jgi:hypothetical protein
MLEYFRDQPFKFGLAVLAVILWLCFLIGYTSEVILKVERDNPFYRFVFTFVFSIIGLLVIPPLLVGVTTLLYKNVVMEENSNKKD